MNELDKKVGEPATEQRPGTQERPTTTNGTAKRTQRSTADPQKTRACGANALQRRQRKAKGRNNTVNFASIDRNKYFNTHIKNPTQGPPIGAYRNKYNEIDPMIKGPLYGTEKTWDNRAFESSQKIKERTFTKSTKICNRIDRTLVLIRPHLYTRMVEESKAASSSLPPFSRGGFGDGHSHFVDNHSAEGARGGRDSIDITKSRFGDTPLSGFYKQN